MQVQHVRLYCFDPTVNNSHEPFQEQPLSASFERLMQAIGLYDHWAESQPTMSAETDQWSQHAVQSVVWSAAGDFTLSPCILLRHRHFFPFQVAMRLLQSKESLSYLSRKLGVMIVADFQSS